MEFFTTAEVVDRRYSKARKVLLGIVCLLDIFVIVIEFLTSGFPGILFFLPLIYLVPAYRKMGEKKYMTEVLAYINIHSDELNIVMGRVIIEKENVYNREYIFRKDMMNVVSNQEQGEIVITGDGTVKISNGNREVFYEQQFMRQSVIFKVRKKTFEELNQYIKSLSE